MRQKKIIPLNDRLILLATATKKNKEYLLTHPEYCPSLREKIKLWRFLRMYKHGYSVAVITHHKEFYGLDFYVNKFTLIPRPETELMVAETIQEIKKTRNQKNNNPPSQGGQGGCWLIDVGTGSGCIPIAINKAIKQCNNVTIKTFATDISCPALRVAKRNAKKHNVKITFLHGNLLTPITRNYELRTKNSELVVITANLPYLTQEQFDREPSIQREPHSALVGGKTSLELYEKLLEQIQSLLLIVNCSLLILLEIDPSQSSAITSLIKKYLPTSKIEIKNDLAGRDRLVIITV